MGFDIDAHPTEKEDDITIADFHCYMGAFRMLREQGYDWFELIDAYDCYGGVSGNGNGKYITFENLKKAYLQLLTHNTNGKLANNNIMSDIIDYRDEFSYRKPILKRFMSKMIWWLLMNKKNKIYIYFG